MILEIQRKRPYRTYRHVQAEIVRKGRKQGEVAEQIGITPQHFSAVLNGYEPMTDRLAREIAFALGIKIADILGDGKRFDMQNCLRLKGNRGRPWLSFLRSKAYRWRS